MEASPNPHPSDTESEAKDSELTGNTEVECMKQTDVSSVIEYNNECESCQPEEEVVTNTLEEETLETSPDPIKPTDFDMPHTINSENDQTTTEFPSTFENTLQSTEMILRLTQDNRNLSDQMDSQSNEDSPESDTKQSSEGNGMCDKEKLDEKNVEKQAEDSEIQKEVDSYPGKCFDTVSLASTTEVSQEEPDKQDPHAETTQTTPSEEEPKTVKCQTDQQLKESSSGTTQSVDSADDLKKATAFSSLSVVHWQNAFSVCVAEPNPKDFTHSSSDNTTPVCSEQEIIASDVTTQLCTKSTQTSPDTTALASTATLNTYAKGCSTVLLNIVSLIAISLCLCVYTFPVYARIYYSANTTHKISSYSKSNYIFPSAEKNQSIDSILFGNSSNLSDTCSEANFTRSFELLKLKYSLQTQEDSQNFTSVLDPQQEFPLIVWVDSNRIIFENWPEYINISGSCSRERSHTKYLSEFSWTQSLCPAVSFFVKGFKLPEPNFPPKQEVEEAFQGIVLPICSAAARFSLTVWKDSNYILLRISALKCIARLETFNITSIANPSMFIWQQASTSLLLHDKELPSFENWTFKTHIRELQCTLNYTSSSKKLKKRSKQRSDSKHKQNKPLGIVAAFFSWMWNVFEGVQGIMKQMLSSKTLQTSKAVKKSPFTIILVILAMCIDSCNAEASNPGDGGSIRFYFIGLQVVALIAIITYMTDLLNHLWLFGVFCLIKFFDNLKRVSESDSFQEVMLFVLFVPFFVCGLLVFSLCEGGHLLVTWFLMQCKRSHSWTSPQFQDSTTLVSSSSEDDRQDKEMSSANCCHVNSSDSACDDPSNELLADSEHKQTSTNTIASVDKCSFEHSTTINTPFEQSSELNYSPNSSKTENLISELLADTHTTNHSDEETLTWSEVVPCEECQTETSKPVPFVDLSPPEPVTTPSGKQALTLCEVVPCQESQVEKADTLPALGNHTTAATSSPALSNEHSSAESASTVADEHTFAVTSTLQSNVTETIFMEVSNSVHLQSLSSGTQEVGTEPGKDKTSACSEADLKKQTAVYSQKTSTLHSASGGQLFLSEIKRTENIPRSFTQSPSHEDELSGSTGNFAEQPTDSSYVHLSLPPDDQDNLPPRATADHRLTGDLTGTIESKKLNSQEDQSLSLSGNSHTPKTKRVAELNESIANTPSMVANSEGLVAPQPKDPQDPPLLSKAYLDAPPIPVDTPVVKRDSNSPDESLQSSQEQSGDHIVTHAEGDHGSAIIPLSKTVPSSDHSMVVAAQGATNHRSHSRKRQEGQPNTSELPPTALVCGSETRHSGSIAKTSVAEDPSSSSATTSNDLLKDTNRPSEPPDKPDNPPLSHVTPPTSAHAINHTTAYASTATASKEHAKDSPTNPYRASGHVQVASSVGEKPSSKGDLSSTENGYTLDKGDGPPLEAKKAATSSISGEGDSVSQPSRRKLPQATIQDLTGDPPPTGDIVDEEETNLSHLPATLCQEHSNGPPQWTVSDEGLQVKSAAHSPSHVKHGVRESPTGLTTVESELGPSSHTAVDHDTDQQQLEKCGQTLPKSVTNLALDTGQEQLEKCGQTSPKSVPNPRTNSALDKGQEQLEKCGQTCPESVPNPSTNSALDTGQPSACPTPCHSGTQSTSPASTPATSHTSSSAIKDGGELEPKKELSQATPRQKRTGDPPGKQQGGGTEETPVNDDSRPSSETSKHLSAKHHSTGGPGPSADSANKQSEGSRPYHSVADTTGPGPPPSPFDVSQYDLGYPRLLCHSPTNSIDGDERTDKTTANGGGTQDQSKLQEGRSMSENSKIRQDTEEYDHHPPTSTPAPPSHPRHHTGASYGSAQQVSHPRDRSQTHSLSISLGSNLQVSSLRRPLATQHNTDPTCSELVIGQSRRRTGIHGNLVTAAEEVVMPPTNAIGHNGSTDTGGQSTHGTYNNGATGGASVGFIGRRSDLSGRAEDSLGSVHTHTRPHSGGASNVYPRGGASVTPGVGTSTTNTPYTQDASVESGYEENSYSLSGQHVVAQEQGQLPSDANSITQSAATEHAQSGQNGDLEPSLSHIISVSHNLGASNHTTFNSVTEGHLPALMLVEEELAEPVQETDHPPIQEANPLPPMLLQEDDILVLICYNEESAFTVNFHPRFSPWYRDQFRRP